MARMSTRKRQNGDTQIEKVENKVNAPTSRAKSKNKKVAKITIKDKKNEQSNSNEAQEIASSLDDQVEFFYGHEKEMSYLKKTIANLFEHSQASSLIVCGDCGFGKSALIETCFSMFPVLNDEPDPNYGHLDVALFNLDGNLQGKNDLATLRLIGRRLNHFLDSSRHVTLDDQDVNEPNEMELSQKVANSIPKIMTQFRYLTEHYMNFRSVIVLENFEVFCRRQQTLLYNLLDLTQHGRSVLVIGATRRLDCIELLEKRVRSRLTQRVIHLTSPFKNLDSYRQFCMFQAKLISTEDQNMSPSAQASMSAFEDEIAKSFSMNQSFDEIRRMVQEYSFAPRRPSGGGPLKTASTAESRECVESGAKTAVDSSIFLRRDPKIVDLSNLTKNELVLLIVATRQLRHQQSTTFTCKQLHEWGSRVVQLKAIRFSLVVKSIYKMIELDLLILANESGHSRTHSTKQSQLWITPWTTLMLNISEFQLNDLLKGLGNKVPSYIKQLLN